MQRIFQPSRVFTQGLNQPHSSSRPAISASNLVKRMMDKISVALLDIKGNKSKVASPDGLKGPLGMALLSMDDTKLESALDIPPGSLTQELKDKIHKELGKFSKQHPYGTGELISSANFIASDYHHRNEQYQYEQMLSDYYQTQKLRIYKNLVKTIDSYVEYKTEGKIKTVFDGLKEDECDEDVRAVIGNVMEFRLVWMAGFSPDKTVGRRFRCADGTFINVKMMCATEKLNMATNRKFTAIAKEFRTVNGEDLKLVAIKPEKSSATAINELDSDTINHLIGKLNDHKVKVDLKLPKIDVAGSCDIELLKKIELALGISIKAQDLSKLGTQLNDRLHMIQKIIASVDEEGARGTIATAAVTTYRGIAEPNPEFAFNCPGYIAIVDGEGNRLLELVIKDGSFLVLDDSPTNTENANSEELRAVDEIATSGQEDVASAIKRHVYERDVPHNLPDDPQSLQKGAKTGFKHPVASTIEALSKHLSANPDQYIDVSHLIQQELSPNGELRIESAKADNNMLSIQVNSPEDTNKVEQKILKLVKEENKCFVTVWKFQPTVVEVMFGAWKALQKHFTTSPS